MKLHEEIFFPIRQITLLRCCRHIQPTEWQYKHIRNIVSFAGFKLEKPHGYIAGVGDMPDGHLQAKLIVRHLVEVPFLHAPGRRLDGVPIEGEYGLGRVTALHQDAVAAQ
ncbi:hypothetical protein D3C76_1542590 [compost metagenome]